MKGYITVCYFVTLTNPEHCLYSFLNQILILFNLKTISLLFDKSFNCFNCSYFIVVINCSCIAFFQCFLIEITSLVAYGVLTINGNIASASFPTKNYLTYRLYYSVYYKILLSIIFLSNL